MGKIKDLLIEQESLYNRVTKAVEPLRDQLDRSPTVWYRQNNLLKQTVEVAVRGWVTAEPETTNIKNSLIEQGFNVIDHYYDDFGDEDCMKVTGLIRVEE